MDRIASTSARGVLIDISALEIVDSFIGRMIGTDKGNHFNLSEALR